VPGQANVVKRLDYLDKQFPPEVVGMVVLTVFDPQWFEYAWDDQASRRAGKIRRELSSRTKYDKHLVWFAPQVAASRNQEEDGRFAYDLIAELAEESAFDEARRLLES
jgi:hypothetical protein